MFKINLSPQVNDKEPPVVSVQGDTLIINGEEFDFSPLQEGETLVNSQSSEQEKAIASDYIDKDVERKNGYIELPLLLPVLWNSPESARFPNPAVLVIEQDGPVTLPDTTPDPTAQPVHGLSLGEALNIATALQQAGIGVQTDEQQQ